MSERERDPSHADKPSDGLGNALGTEYVLRIEGSQQYHDFVTSESFAAERKRAEAFKEAMHSFEQAAKFERDRVRRWYSPSLRMRCGQPVR